MIGSLPLPNWLNSAGRLRSGGSPPHQGRYRPVQRARPVQVDVFDIVERAALARGSVIEPVVRPPGCERGLARH